MSDAREGMTMLTKKDFDEAYRIVSEVTTETKLIHSDYFLR